jgi:hypothetical protein
MSFFGQGGQPAAAERLKVGLESCRAGRPLREKPATIPDR